MISIWLIPLFFLGLCVGSFLNVLIDRLPRGENPFRGRSHCDYCGKTLSSFELIPLLSFLYLKGKCKHCQARLSIQYPIIEFFTAIMFVLLYFYSANSFHLSLAPRSFGEAGLITFRLINYISLITIFSSFLVIFVADLKYQIIPDEMLVSLGAGILGHLLVSVSIFQIPNYFLTAFVMFILFYGIYFFTKKKGLGFGDVKLAPFLGLFLGFPKIIVGLYAAFLTGGFLSSILLFTGKKKWGAKIAFGPFLIFGTIFAFIFSDIAIFWYLSLF